MVLGLALGILLTSQIVARGYLRAVVFFPVLVSTVGVGITFTAMMHPTAGVIHTTLALFGIRGPGWLTDPHLALISVALMDNTCPPSTVYAAYNAYGGDKRIVSYTFNDHEGGGVFQERDQLAFLREAL